MCQPKWLIVLTSLLVVIFISISCRERKPASKTLATGSRIDTLPDPIVNCSLPLVNYVHDCEDIFIDKEEATLDSLIRNFENKTTIEIAVLTIATTMTSKDSLEAFTLKTATTWRVGKKDKNNGILVGISRGYRRMRIENGVGIGKMLKDLETKDIITTDFIPFFKEDNFFQGTYNGLTVLMKTLEERSKNEDDLE